jgi:AcrR family transcriptional regulator
LQEKSSALRLYVNNVDLMAKLGEVIKTTRAKPKPIGRPAGSPPNRQAILAAARRLFIELGYFRSTIRAIAARAGCDPALVIHYFGSKERLFLAALTDDFRPESDRFIDEQVSAGTSGLGERLVRASLQAWFADLGTVPAAAQFLAVASTSEQAASVLREIVTEGGVFRLVSALGLSQPKLRATLIGSTVFGLVLARFVVRIEPVASADVDELVAWYAPTVQRYLTMPLPKSPSAPQDETRRTLRQGHAPISGNR